MVKLDLPWIIKVDANNGGKIWEKNYGGKNYEHLEDIIKNPSGGYYAIGTACNKKSPLRQAIFVQRICQPFG